MAQPNHDELMTPEQAAQFLSLSTTVLGAWRSLGRYGLPYLKLGRQVRYRRKDLVAFLERNTIGVDEAA